MKHLLALSLLLLSLAACSGPGAATPGGGLMYRVPDPPMVRYAFAQTQDITVEIPSMGAMDMAASTDGKLAMSFARGEGGIEVTVTYEELTASQSDPMGGGRSASESDIVGDLVFTIDERGVGTPVTVPEVKGAARELVFPVGLVHEFLPHLPGRAVAPGDTWTDTASYEVAGEGMTRQAKTVLTYTMAGDTVVNGGLLVNITFDGESDVVVEMVNEGMPMVQRASGSVTGMFFWDPARGLMVQSESSMDLEGGIEMAGSGMPSMFSTIKAKETIQLQGG